MRSVKQDGAPDPARVQRFRAPAQTLEVVPLRGRGRAAPDSAIYAVAERMGVAYLALQEGIADFRTRARWNVMRNAER